MMQPRHKFARVTTAALSWHVQSYDRILSLFGMLVQRVLPLKELIDEFINP